MQPHTTWLGFPGGARVEEPACQHRRQAGMVPGSGRSPGRGHDNPLQYSHLENPHGQEPGRLQSMGSQRVGHNWVTYHAQCTTWLYKYFFYILLSILLEYVLFYPLSTYVIGINGRRKVNCFNEWKNGVELLNVWNEFVHLNDDPSFGACLFLWGEVYFVE